MGRHYLDNFLMIFSPASPLSLVSEALDWMLDLGHHLGLCFQDSKIEGPTNCIKFLRIQLDSVVMEARLSPRKLADLHELLRDWHRRSHCTLCKLEQLTGYLQFCSQVVPLSRAFLRALYDFQATFTSSLTQRRIPGPARKDLSWWFNMAVQWNGIHFISPKRKTIHVYTDASGTKGIGGFLGNKWFSKCTPQRL